MKNLVAPVLTASQTLAGAAGFDAKILRNLVNQEALATHAAIVGHRYPLATSYEVALIVLLQKQGLPLHIGPAAFRRAAEAASGRHGILEALALGLVPELQNAPCQAGPAFWVMALENAEGTRQAVTIAHLIRTENCTVAINELSSARGHRSIVTIDVKRLVADVDQRLFHAGATIPAAHAA